jgi:hypothetical protein
MLTELVIWKLVGNWVTIVGFGSLLSKRSAIVTVINLTIFKINNLDFITMFDPHNHLTLSFTLI